jgi:hypothetical protein
MARNVELGLVDVGADSRAAWTYAVEQPPLRLSAHCKPLVLEIHSQGWGSLQMFRGSGNRIGITGIS